MTDLWDRKKDAFLTTSLESSILDVPNCVTISSHGSGDPTQREKRASVAKTNGEDFPLGLGGLQCKF